MREFASMAQRGGRRAHLVLVAVLAGLLAACGPAGHAPPAAPASQRQTAGEAERTLASLRLVDSHPLYTMTFYGGYTVPETPATAAAAARPAARPWGCSLFAASGAATALYGRNFDWSDHPALLLFTHPPGGYAAVSMVDLSYLGYDRAHLAALGSPAGRRALLRAPLLPFDGMNDHGLVVGMAADDQAVAPHDPAKPTTGGVRVIRLLLDQARTVDQAVAIIGRHNLDFSGGPPLHYLVADATGRAAVVEFVDGRQRVTHGDGPWLAAVNFQLSGSSARQRQHDWRYRTASGRLAGTHGSMSWQAAMGLLRAVAQPITRWSVVYGMRGGDVHLAMDRDYQRVHSFRLPMSEADG
jgi:Acyl-coenzyme A:6-aminopenicillanic acid acyl-transferase